MAMTDNGMEGGHVLIKCLEQAGIKHVFGLSGGAALPIFDALVATGPTWSSSWSATSRAPRTWPTATRAPRESRPACW